MVLDRCVEGFEACLDRAETMQVQLGERRNDAEGVRARDGPCIAASA